jgi:hypothetical protein
MVGRCFAKDRLLVVAALDLPIPTPGVLRWVPGVLMSRS